MAIRVLQVIGSMNQGGAENFLMNLYREIDKTKIQFDFLVNRRGIFDNEIKKLGGNVYHINSLQKSGQIRYTKELRKFFRGHNYKIIHSHINKVSGLILECAKKEGIPVRIAHSHNNNSSDNLIVNTYKAYLGQKIHINATTLLACSHDAAIHMFGKYGENAIILNNAIDLDRFKYSNVKRNEIRKKYKINEETILIGCIARFSKQKNHIFLIDIFNEYAKNNTNTKLILVGEGPLEQAVKEKIKAHNLQDKVIFAGTTFETEKYYSAFDCFILPSLFEGLGIVLIEAQISGLNCLTSKDVVPPEAKISDRLEYIDLNEEPKVWANHISKSKNRANSNIGSEYDIKKTAKKLEMLYIKSVKGIKA